MLPLLALCLMIDGGVPPEGGVELKVYRSARELPARWAALLPRDFDFKKQMVASSAGPSTPVVLVAPLRIERHLGAAHLWGPPAPPQPQTACPPCRGVAEPRDFLLEEPAARAIPATPVFVLPRARGKVFLQLELAVAAGPNCPPCMAP